MRSNRRGGRPAAPRSALLAGIVAFGLLCSNPAPAAAQSGRAIDWLGQGTEWLNTPAPIDPKSLRGKFVLLDFWTYCCINCMHILPELKKLEHAYPNHLVVIGVHSGKFDAEHDTANIRKAILRYEIEHPVINDADYALWNRFRVDLWPTLVLIDPEGKAIRTIKGEVEFAALRKLIHGLLPEYRRKGMLDETPLAFNLEQHKAQDTPLRFPGKVLADARGGRLFIADSNHNRIVVGSLEGRLLDVIGDGAVGSTDGNYDKARFHHPQGMALAGETLLVADTENHLVRKIDLKGKHVRTLAGVGKQRRDPVPVTRRQLGSAQNTALSSPWALAVARGDLYIAMAGSHQIWRMPLNGGPIGVYAGSGVEDIVDGPLLKAATRGAGAAFAQPSGLAVGGDWLYVADSEGSSIRKVPLEAGEVATLIGTAGQEDRRLFTFGDRDGPAAVALLQHPLDVAFHEGRLYIADTYNSKIKALDLEEQTVAMLEVSDADARPGRAPFDEPGGVSIAGGKLYVADTNGHRIRVVDLGGGMQTTTLDIDGLQPPSPHDDPSELVLPKGKRLQVKAAEVGGDGGWLKLAVDLTLPDGYTLNDLAPMRYWVESKSSQGPVDRTALGRVVRLSEPATKFEFALPLTEKNGSEALQVSLVFYYCDESGTGLCKVGSVVWSVPVRLSEDAPAGSVRLSHRVE